MIKLLALLRYATAVVSCISVSHLDHCVVAEDWPHWRGPNRSGHTSEDSGWDAGAWPPGKPSWSSNVGRGSCSAVVVDGRGYTLGWSDGQDHVVCFDARSGKTIWQASYRCPEYGRHSTGDEGLYAGPCATPEFDRQTGYLYTLGADGDLHCWDTRDGRKVWGLNLYERYQVAQRPRYGRQGLRDYGYTAAAIVRDELLIVEVGDDEGHLMAFSKHSGKRIWASAYKGPAGHTGGLAPMEVDRVPCIASLGFEGLHVARLDRAHAGETVALYPWPTDFANNIATPAVRGSDVLITSGYNHNAICRIHVTLDGATKVWEQPYASKVCSPIIAGERVYWAWQRLYCLDFATGQLLWRGGSFGDAGSCMLTADQRLIIWADQGRLVLAESAERSPAAFRELAALEDVFSTDVWPHVVLAEGRLLCKDRLGNLKSFELRARVSR